MLRIILPREPLCVPVWWAIISMCADLASARGYSWAMTGLNQPASIPLYMYEPISASSSCLKHKHMHRVRLFSYNTWCSRYLTIFSCPVQNVLFGILTASAADAVYVMGYKIQNMAFDPVTDVHSDSWLADLQYHRRLSIIIPIDFNGNMLLGPTMNGGWVMQSMTHLFNRPSLLTAMALLRWKKKHGLNWPHLCIERNSNQCIESFW